MSKQILIETQYFTPTKFSIIEGKLDRGLPTVQGILATAEIKNGNGRYYKKSLWEREINNYMENVRDKHACGELDHPESSVINLKNVCHNIIDIWWDGDNIMGKMEILPTPSGNILKSLIDSGIKLGVSSRGMGSLKEDKNGVLEVQEDFDLLCWDFVSTPSNPGSYMNTLNEGFTSTSNHQNSNTDPYKKVRGVITEILCTNSTCPVF